MKWGKNSNKEANFIYPWVFPILHHISVRKRKREKRRRRNISNSNSDKALCTAARVQSTIHTIVATNGSMYSKIKLLLSHRPI